MGCSQTLTQQNTAMKAALVSLQKKLKDVDSQMAELAQEKEAFCRKGQKDEERVSEVQAQLKEMARQLASSEHSHQEQSLRMRRVQQELHEQSLASGAAKQELVIKSDKLDSLQRQNQNLMDTKDQLESNLTKARAETAELASRVLQLETKCSSLEGAGRDAEQQHRHDRSYQNELLVDRQQATQDAQRLRQELASAKHTATQQEHALHMQRASLKQELEHVTARNAALNARVQEQAEHLKISLAAVTNLQHSDIHAHIHVFNSQANSLLHRYQAVLAQASGNVSHLEAQVASLQQSLLQAKTLMHVELQDAVAGRNQANKTIRASARPGILTSIRAGATGLGAAALLRELRIFMVAKPYVPMQGRDASRVIARSRDALRCHLQRQQGGRRDPLPALWEPLPQPDLASPRTVAGSPAASPGRACDPGRSHRTLPMQIWADNSCSSSSSLAMGMQTVQESLQAEYDELYEHYQELAEQVRFMEDEGQDAEPTSDLSVLHVALREVVDACDNKAAQIQALQQL
ncbi:MAG: hypothetical protein FRX49_06636 [Trebouxia sp. A1-2]|nr:MAG: hypothetical protein FRX49_06636 [Trebouxia sp. A1-2]